MLNASQYIKDYLESLLFELRLLIVCVLVLCGQSYAEQESTSAPTLVTSIPFRLDDYMFIEVDCFDTHETLHAIFDSGSSNHIFNTPFASRLGASLATESAATATGETNIKLYSSTRMRAREFDLSAGKDVGVYGLQFFSDRIGQEVDAVVSADPLLQAGILEIDFEGKNLNIHRRDTWSPPENYVRLPLSVDPSGVPHVTIEFPNSKCDFVIDTGSSGVMSCTPATSRTLGVDTEGGRLVPGASASSKMVSRLGVLRSLPIGPMQLTHVPVKIAKSNRIGLELLRRFQLIFNVEHGWIYFLPREGWEVEFAQDRSGLSIAKHDGRLIVESVDLHSPSFNAGIHPGDFIVLARAENIAQPSFKKLREMLRGPVGKKVSLTIERSGVEKVLTFSLQDFQEWGPPE